MIITKIEKQKKNKNRSSIYIDDRFSFGIDDFDLFKLKLKVGDEITEKRLSEIKETVLLTSAKEYAVSIVSRFTYTKKAITEKLKNKDYDNETINKTLLFLEEYKLIDDYDYAKRYISDALNIKHFGIKKIKYELMQKGISSDIVDSAISEFDAECIEEESILPLAKKRLGGNFEYKNIMKVKRYLVSKGFSFDLIDKTISLILNEKGEL